MKRYLFAYGTLAEDQVPAEIAAAVRKLKCIGEGFVRGRLYDLGHFPGAVLSGRPTDKVIGKIFELPEDRALLNKLDAYEGFEPGRPRQSLFVRKRTSILRPKQSPLTGWVYEYNGDVKSFPIIKNGRYPKLSPSPA